jgi:hypothetical protein
VVSLGSGLRWQDVYDALAPYQLAVSGGRWGHVGTGLLLGGITSPILLILPLLTLHLGGLSFFQGTYSFACDNIINHEVRLPRSQSRCANTSVYLHSFLFWEAYVSRTQASLIQS